MLKGVTGDAVRGVVVYKLSRRELGGPIVLEIVCMDS
jgi:hypothetical protein